MPRKNVEYIPVTMNPRTMLEPIRLRTCSRRSGMIGFSIDDSSSRKQTINTTATAPKPMTSGEPQPWAVASTIA